MSTQSEARQGLIDLTELSRRELFAVWAVIASMPPAQARPLLAEVLPEIGATYGTAAAALAADWYDDIRERAGAAGSFRAEPVEPASRARWLSLAAWGTKPLQGDIPDYESALALIDGGLQRTVADQHRFTIVENSKRDKAAKGWRRVGVGESCGFCQMLIDRGHVYTQSGAFFKSHDHCNCFAAPAFTMTGAVSPIAYEQSQNRPRSDEARKKANQAVYDYIRQHYGAGAL